jgi:hypothetical protein
VQWPQRPAAGVPGDAHQAEGAVLLGGGGGRGFLEGAEAVVALHQQEDGEGDDDEGDDVVEEEPVVQRRRAGLARLRERRVLARGEIDEEVGEVDAARGAPDRRHQDVVHEALHDGREGGADDDADGEVDDVPADDELAKFRDHGVSPACW